MATAKKTGIVARMKNAVTGMFSSGDAKRAASVGATHKKTAKTVKKAAKKATAKAKKRA